MSRYFVSKLQVTGLWNYRDMELSFFKDVNIIVGPNASGKTTVLNLLGFVLNADIARLSEINFREILISLRSFDGTSNRRIKVTPSEGGLIYKIGTEAHNIDFRAFRRTRDPYLSSRQKVLFPTGIEDLVEKLTKMVEVVWLPVSRRLPIAEDFDERSLEAQRRERYRENTKLESVDESLRGLLTQLAKYRSTINAQLAVRYKEFERELLQMILFSKQHDQVTSLTFEMVTEEQKKQLIRTFKDAGLLDTHMQERINDHFVATAEALERLKRQIDADDPESPDLDMSSFFVLPLIKRTESLIRYSEELESKREELFRPLTNYIRIVNTFLQGKIVSVTDDGELILSSVRDDTLTIETLSSGEKQILILLTQALLGADDQTVYMADEPELSLHVSWQEMLLASILELAGDVQVIVATHSPDIVGKFSDNIIELR